MKHTQEKYGLKKGAEVFPLLIALSISNLCNSKCPNCVYTQNPHLREKYGDYPYMTWEVFQKIADEAGRHKALLRFSGTGEPLLNPNIIKFLEYAHDKGCRVGLITNGSLVDSQKAMRIVASEIEAIEFSVDCADPETYKKLRPGLNWETTYHNIMRVRQLRDEWESPIKVLVSIVENDEIDVGSTKAFWMERVDNVIVRKYLRWGLISKENKTAPYLPKEKRVPCPFPFERLNIDTSGGIRFCGYDVDYNVILGNVLKDSIESVWTGETFNKWRRYHLDGTPERIEMCKNCTDYPYRSWNYNYWNVLDEA